MNALLQVSGLQGASGGFDLADQLGGPSMDLAALNLKIGLVHRHDIQMGLATAFLRVQSDENRRAAEIMRA
jgi:hypothetical protein